MKNPLKYRTQIPFFYDKTEAEFRQDQYERFEQKVIRQTALHLADQLWPAYPFQPALDFATKHLQISPNQNIVEIGCSVGRWIGELATQYPTANFWGIDFSYQMLKRAHEFWVDQNSITLNMSHLGFSPIEINGKSLKNIQFGLAKAEDLPFEAASQDVVLSSFLLDRLDDPKKGLEEMWKVLRTGGKMVLISPLNFFKKTDWEQFQPPIKLYHILLQMGFEILDWEDSLILEEPLDCRGNAVKWNCVGVVAQKK